MCTLPHRGGNQQSDAITSKLTCSQRAGSVITTREKNRKYSTLSALYTVHLFMSAYILHREEKQTPHKNSVSANYPSVSLE